MSAGIRVWKRKQGHAFSNLGILGLMSITSRLEEMLETPHLGWKHFSKWKRDISYRQTKTKLRRQEGKERCISGNDEHPV